MAKNSVHLPQEVISEILLKLPVKTLLRCRSVCKLWLSLISDPHFTTSHFQLASSTRLLFIEYRDSQTLSIDFNAWLDDDSAFSLSPDFLHLESRPEIGGSCRGFLFIYCYRDFYLWNPSTRVHKQIPLSPLTIASNSDDSGSSSNSSSDSDNDHYSIFNLLYGFGYDVSTDDYMVVLGSYKFNPTVCCSIDLEIFSLRANEWEEIEFDSDLPYTKTARSQSGPRVGSFLNGSIHWLVYNYETRSDVIIAYDLKEMTMSEIGLPDDFDIDFSTDIYDLSVFRGLISVWNVEMSTLKIWVMQEYAVDSSWIKTLDFNFEPAPDFCPVCFTDGGDIVGPVADGGLAKLDDEGDLLQYHTYGGCYFARSQLAVYTESLLSLPDGIEQA
jgi:F-box interacting protein